MQQVDPPSCGDRLFFFFSYQQFPRPIPPEPPSFTPQLRSSKVGGHVVRETLEDLEVETDWFF